MLLTINVNVSAQAKYEKPETVRGKTGKCKSKNAVTFRCTVADILHNFRHQPKEKGSEEKQIKIIKTGSKAMTLDMSRTTIGCLDKTLPRE